jgi:uncharacterized protein YacL
MNTTTSNVLQNYLSRHSFAQVTDTTSAIAVGLLLAILVEREILRISKPESARRNVVALATVVLPMTVIFAAVIVARFFKLST